MTDLAVQWAGLHCRITATPYFILSAFHDVLVCCGRLVDAPPQFSETFTLQKLVQMVGRRVHTYTGNPCHNEPEKKDQLCTVELFHHILNSIASGVLTYRDATQSIIDDLRSCVVFLGLETAKFTIGDFKSDSWLSSLRSVGLWPDEALVRCPAIRNGQS